MQVFPGPPTCFFIILLAAGSLSGSYLIITSFKRRDQDTRFCRRCRYNLTGLSSWRCPECGADLSTARNVARGRRLLRKRRLAIGVAVLVVTSVPMLAAAWRTIGPVNGYRYLPYRVLLLLVRTNSGNVPHDAWREIETRLDAGAFSSGQLRVIGERLLAEQISTKPTNVTHDMIRRLGTSQIQNELSDEQQERYYRQCVRDVKLAVSPTVGRDAPVPLRFSMTLHAPLQRSLADIRIVSLTANGNEILRERIIGAWSGFALCSRTIMIELHDKGPCRLEALVQVRIVPAHNGLGAAAPLWTSAEIPLVAKTVVAETSAIELRRSEDLDTRMQTTMRIEQVTISDFDESAGGYKLAADLTYPQPAECHVRSDMIVEHAGARISLTRSGRQSENGHITAFYRGTLESLPDDGTINLLVSPSRAQALREVDIDTIWGGTLRFQIDLNAKAGTVFHGELVTAE